MAEKKFKNLSEQIEIMKSKGLIINDEEDAKVILLRENYFFINGYRYIFMKSKNDKKFVSGATFDELYALFTFDRRFRNIIFKNVLIIENNIKSVISYQLSKKYGYRDKDYLRPESFSLDRKKSRQVNDLIHKMKRQVRVNGQKHSATMHYINNYGYVPLWILVKVLSFGIISEMYSILKPEDQLVIADYYDLDIHVLENYLALLSNYRNLCAHEDILFDNKTQRFIDDTKYHKCLDIPTMDGEYIYGKNDLFALIIILKQMLSDEEFRLLIYEIGYELDILDGKVESIPQSKILDAMGFPENFRDIVKIEGDIKL
ncbi:MAG: Abi family protein [Firmicutes bacterium]|nr:Abi family protein [Bacillota bacterium]